MILALAVGGIMKINTFSILFAVLLIGCADLSAVTKFSQTAPDIAKLDALNDVYISDPQTMSEWESIWQVPDPRLMTQKSEREKQKVALDSLHELLINYMKALGDLSGSKVTDVSTQAKAVSTNLSTLQKANQINLSANQVSSIGDLVSVVPQDMLNIWRADKVAQLIRENQKPFQALVSTEITVIGEIYCLDYDNVARTIESAACRLEGSWPKTKDQNPVSRAAHFSFQQNVVKAKTRIENAKTAAQKYVEALKKLSAAYNILVEQSDHFSSQTLLAILPLLDDANKAYVDVRNL
jgi:predicted secreted protein